MLDVNVYLKLGGIVTEEIWFDRLVNLNLPIKQITISRGIERIEMEAYHYYDEQGQSETSLDAHIWLAPSNV